MRSYWSFISSVVRSTGSQQSALCRMLYLFLFLSIFSRSVSGLPPEPTRTVALILYSRCQQFCARCSTSTTAAASLRAPCSAASPAAGSAMISALIVLLSAGGEVGGGESRVRNWRDTATLVPRKKAPVSLRDAAISQG